MILSRLAVVAMSLLLTVKIPMTRLPAAQHLLLRHLSAQPLQVCCLQAGLLLVRSQVCSCTLQVCNIVCTVTDAFNVPHVLAS